MSQPGCVRSRASQTETRFPTSSHTCATWQGRRVLGATTGTMGEVDFHSMPRPLLSCSATDEGQTASIEHWQHMLLDRGRFDAVGNLNKRTPPIRGPLRRGDGRTCWMALSICSDGPAEHRYWSSGGTKGGRFAASSNGLWGLKMLCQMLSAGGLMRTRRQNRLISCSSLILFPCLLSGA